MKQSKFKWFIHYSVLMCISLLFAGCPSSDDDDELITDKDNPSQNGGGSSMTDGSGSSMLIKKREETMKDGSGQLQFRFVNEYEYDNQKRIISSKYTAYERYPEGDMVPHFQGHYFEYQNNLLIVKTEWWWYGPNNSSAGSKSDTLVLNDLGYVYGIRTYYERESRQKKEGETQWTVIPAGSRIVSEYDLEYDGEGYLMKMGDRLMKYNNGTLSRILKLKQTKYSTISPIYEDYKVYYISEEENNMNLNLSSEDVGGDVSYLRQFDLLGKRSRKLNKNIAGIKLTRDSKGRILIIDRGNTGNLYTEEKFTYY